MYMISDVYYNSSLFFKVKRLENLLLNANFKIIISLKMW